MPKPQPPGSTARKASRSGRPSVFFRSGCICSRENLKKNVDTWWLVITYCRHLLMLKFLPRGLVGDWIWMDLSWIVLAKKDSTWVYVIDLVHGFDWWICLMDMWRICMVLRKQDVWSCHPKAMFFCQASWFWRWCATQSGRINYVTKSFGCKQLACGYPYPPQYASICNKGNSQVTYQVTCVFSGFRFAIWSASHWLQKVPWVKRLPDAKNKTEGFQKMPKRERFFLTD